MVVQHLLYHPKGKGLSLFIAASDTGKNYVVCKQVAKPKNQHAFIKVLLQNQQQEHGGRTLTLSFQG
jgi:hypothetical protein